MPQDLPGVMHEWGSGELHSGSSTGKVVPKTKAGQRQALAIAFSEQRKLGGSAAKSLTKKFSPPSQGSKR